MKKLTTLVAIVAMSAGLGAAGCKNKQDKNQEPAAKAIDDKGGEMAKPNDMKAPAQPEAAAAAPTGALPAECDEYKAAIEKATACDKLPQATRDALKQSYEQTSAAWATIPAEGRGSVSKACKKAADAARASAAACGE